MAHTPMHSRRTDNGAKARKNGWVRPAVLAAVALGLLTGGPVALADDVLVGGLPYKNVRIERVDGADLVFVVNGRETKKPLAQVTRIAVPSEPALTAAEDAYVAQDWEKAADSYRKAFDASGKQWVKDWAAVRLLETASKVDRFDLVIRAYVALLLKDPATVKDLKLSMPKADSTYLTDAINAVRAAHTDRLSPEQKKLLYGLTIELANAKGDPKLADEALLELQKLDPNNPAARRALARRALAELSSALEAKSYDKVITAVERDGDQFTDSADQAEALFLLAEALAGKAGDKKDAKEWSDVALAYMRLPANFTSDTPRVGEAMLRTAQILEKQLSRPDAALQLYEQVVSEFSGQPAGQKAKEQVTRLKAG